VHEVAHGFVRLGKTAAHASGKALVVVVPVGGGQLRREEEGLAQRLQPLLRIRAANCPSITRSSRNESVLLKIGSFGHFLKGSGQRCGEAQAHHYVGRA
jgi:hypothetical protein